MSDAWTRKPSIPEPTCVGTIERPYSEADPEPDRCPELHVDIGRGEVVRCREKRGHQERRDPALHYADLPDGDRVAWIGRGEDRSLTVAEACAEVEKLL